MSLIILNLPGKYSLLEGEEWLARRDTISGTEFPPAAMNTAGHTKSGTTKYVQTMYALPLQEALVA